MDNFYEQQIDVYSKIANAQMSNPLTYTAGLSIEDAKAEIANISFGAYRAARLAAHFAFMVYPALTIIPLKNGCVCYNDPAWQVSKETIEKDSFGPCDNFVKGNDNMCDECDHEIACHKREPVVK